MIMEAEGIAWPDLLQQRVLSLAVATSVRASGAYSYTLQAALRAWREDLARRD